ncbi:MAG: BatA domain-containing protein, partial [Planctomycetota bacterium]
MQFAYSPLAWGFLLVLVPLLIHLINLVRHKRTPWAAMEFLLESYRKNRRWVWLKQALLIASRMLAMALLVGMLAQWLTDSKMFAWMGRTNVHHYVILDDSASMHDSANNKSAYQNALGAIASISASAKQDSQNHLLSI